MTSALKLNVGCGRNIMSGWLNLDSYPLPGVDIVADLNNCAASPLPLVDASVHEFLLSHVLEHIPNVLPMMQELHRVAADNAVMVIRVPYSSSDDAFEDPTHVRQIFEGSFGYFSQPYYWRADYGYRGDWITDSIQLRIAEKYRNRSPAEIFECVSSQRNVVTEMIANLRAVKPIRRPLRELQARPHISLI